MADTFETRDPARPSRRSVVRGAAWSVPVVSVAATAPAFATSPSPCPAIPPASQWGATRIVSGTAAAKADGYAWDTTTQQWVIYKDNSTSSSVPLVFESTSPSFTVVPGSTNTGSLSFSWGYGNGQAGQSAQGTFQILLNQTVIFTVSRPGSPLVPSVQAVTFTVPAGLTSATLTYRYTIQPQAGKPASDDISVGRVSFSSCTVN